MMTQKAICVIHLALGAFPAPSSWATLKAIPSLRAKTIINIKLNKVREMPNTLMVTSALSNRPVKGKTLTQYLVI